MAPSASLEVAERLSIDQSNSGHASLDVLSGTLVLIAATPALPRGTQPSLPASSTLRNAFCGISTCPNCFIRFLPSFCFWSSFFLRLMSPP